MNCVAPGPIWTPLIPATMPDEAVKNFGSSYPMGRPGQPVEVAPIYVLLASDEASYISGSRYAVTGGKPILQPKKGSPRGEPCPLPFAVFG